MQITKIPRCELNLSVLCISVQEAVSRSATRIHVFISCLCSSRPLLGFRYAHFRQSHARSYTIKYDACDLWSRKYIVHVLFSQKKKKNPLPKTHSRQCIHITHTHTADSVLLYNTHTQPCLMTDEDRVRDGGTMWCAGPAVDLLNLYRPETTDDAIVICKAWVKIGVEIVHAGNVP